jgi:anti-sigma B factor antagonist
MSTTDEPISTSVAYRDEIAVLSIGGELDATAVPVVEAAVAGVLGDRPAGLVIDLSAVTFMSSSGLQFLVSTCEQIDRSKFFAVAAQHAAVMKRIQMFRLDEMFSVYPTVDNALAAMRNAMPSPQE